MVSVHWLVTEWIAQRYSAFSRLAVAFKQGCTIQLDGTQLFVFGLPKLVNGMCDLLTPFCWGAQHSVRVAKGWTWAYCSPLIDQEIHSFMQQVNAN